MNNEERMVRVYVDFDFDDMDGSSISDMIKYLEIVQARPGSEFLECEIEFDGEGGREITWNAPLKFVDPIRFYMDNLIQENSDNSGVRFPEYYSSVLMEQVCYNGSTTPFDATIATIAQTYNLNVLDVRNAVLRGLRERAEYKKSGYNFTR